MNKHPIRRAVNLVIGSDLVMPAILLLGYAIFLFFIRGILPTSEELFNFFAHYYAQYGYEILFTAALLESLVLINLFAPGQIALALGIIFSRTGETHLSLVMMTVVAGVLAGFLIDYLIGYYGFGDFLKKVGHGAVIDKAKHELEKNGGASIFIAFINPNIGSYMSLAAGTSKLNILMFLMIAIFSVIFWVTAWSLLIYSLGDIVLNIIKKYSLVLSAIFVGILILSFSFKSTSKNV